MKSTKDVKAFYRSATVGTNPARDEAVLADALRGGGLTTKERAARAEPSVWRAIMESRTTQLATAAIIAIAVIFGLSRFDEPVVKAVEFTEIAQAMERVPWMHMSATGSGRGFADVGEQWVGFETKIHAGKSPNGNVTFADARNHRRYEFEAQSNTLTVSYMNSLPLNLPSPTVLLEVMRKMLEQQGAETTVTMGRYEGQTVQIQKMALTRTGPDKTESHTLTLYVDPDAKVLRAAAVRGVDAEGSVIMDGTITFDYPATGPMDVYDLGVPPDAQIVDNAPAADFQRVWDEYRRCRAAATSEYAAVITHRSPVDDVVDMVDVNFQSGRKLRQERHFVFHRGEVLDEHWPTRKEQLGDSFASLLAWSRAHYDDPRAIISIYLYDGEYDCSTKHDAETGWSPLEKDYSPEMGFGPLTSLGHLAWPGIASTAHVIEDDYAQQNGLICCESLGQGRVDPGGWPSLPSRWLRYLDPSRDYLCVRQLTEWRPDAPWQEDKDWLAEVDPDKMRLGSITVTEITEAVQAPNGHWYPRVIVEKSTGRRFDYKKAPLRTSQIKRVYLDVSPEFPAGIFDVNELPGP
ncbi:MAG: hypothetical protein JSW27_05220 [Phycisphaerales bacterium]|nr:MAG: hypothetical protein JSW27_05220 [Phycisphaerales bacterium]